MLNVMGIALGPDADMLDADGSNPDGYWENRQFVGLNDELLTLLGGGWDHPPPLSRLSSASWLDDVRDRAAALLVQFDGHEHWGWKDPRSSLVLPFWLELAPATKIVLCVRNPLEVALSLRQRGASSFSFSLALWFEYNRRVLDTTTSAQRRTVHYAKILHSPSSGLDETLDFLGLAPAREARERSGATPNSQGRHHRLTLRDLHDADVTEEIIDLYRNLCDEAGWNDDHRGDGGPEGGSTLAPKRRSRASGVPRLLDPAGIDLTILRREVDALRHDQEPREARIRELEAKRVHLEKELARTTHIARGELEEALVRGLEGLRAQVHAQHESLSAALAEEFLRLHRRLDSIEDDVDKAFAKVTAVATSEPATDVDIEYAHALRRLRRGVHRLLPPDCSVLVVSRGDDEMLQLFGRDAQHFPQADDGGWSGYHPGDAAAAIAALESLRTKGAEYLVVPACSDWWFDHYQDFAEHLDSRYARLDIGNQTGTIYALGDSSSRLPGTAGTPRLIK